MPDVTVVYWRDIPAQVIGRDGRAKVKKELAPRFAKAIDRAAMRAGKGSSDAYIAEWRREPTLLETDGDLREIADGEIARLEAEYPDERLRQMIRNHGSNEPR